MSNDVRCPKCGNEIFFCDQNNYAKCDDCGHEFQIPFTLGGAGGFVVFGGCREQQGSGGNGESGRFHPMPNMFDMDGWEKVVYCKDCQHSYTPITVTEDKPVVTARFCGLTNRIKRDDGFCDEGAVRDTGGGAGE